MLIDINSPTSDRELRWFAGLWFPALCLAAGFFAIRHHASPIAVAIWISGGALAAAGLMRPAIIRPLFRTLIWLTFPIGWVLSHALLLVLYYVIVTPIGVLVRRFQDPMERTFDRAAKSYWTPRESAESHRYFRQF